MQLTREQFARTLFQGLGRPLIYARAHDTAVFADLILDACLINPLYDRQVDGGRAPYLRELIAATGSEAYFRQHILAALANPDEDMDEELLFDLALAFAQEGDDSARRVMQARFLDTVSNGETTGADQLATLGGADGLRFVVLQIGAALARAVDFSDSWLPESLLDDLEVAAADDRATLNDWRVAAFRSAVRGTDAEQAAQVERQARRRELRARLPGLSYAELRVALESHLLGLPSLKQWGQQASAAELRRAADDLLAEPAPSVQWRLLLIFGERDFPYGPEPLLPLLDRTEPLLAHRAALALARFCSPALRTRALAMLADTEAFERGLILLVGNHAPGDERLLAELARDQANDDALHALGWWAHERFTRAPSAEAADLLLTLYERGPCAQCRQYLVADLLALGALPPALAAECRFDANEAVRELVAGLGG